MYIYIYNTCIYSYISFLTFVIVDIFPKFSKGNICKLCSGIKYFSDFAQIRMDIQGLLSNNITDFSWKFSVSWKVLAC